MYSLSPFMVEVVDETQDFTTFLVNVCAIIGGVFAVFGVLDSVLYYFSKRVKTQQKLGGLTAPKR